LLTWYYENLAGIRSDKTEVAFKKTIMKPNLPTGLEFVNASYNSIHGIIKSDWKRKDDKFEWSVSIPANSSAVIYIPAKSLGDVTESGLDLSNAEGVQSMKWENGLTILQMGSGQYKFISKIK